MTQEAITMQTLIDLLPQVVILIVMSATLIVTTRNSKKALKAQATKEHVFFMRRKFEEWIKASNQYHFSLQDRIAEAKDVLSDSIENIDELNDMKIQLLKLVKGDSRASMVTILAMYGSDDMVLKGAEHLANLNALHLSIADVFSGQSTEDQRKDFRDNLDNYKESRPIFYGAMHKEARDWGREDKLHQ